MNHMKTAIFLITITLTSIAFAGTGDTSVPALSPEEKLMAFYRKAPLGGTEGWELKKEEKGIKIYVRSTSLSPINAFKGIMEIKADVSAMTAFLMDIDNYPSCVRLCAETKVLKQINETEKYMYALNAIPWPVSPRDLVCYRKWSQDPETLAVQVDFVSAPDYIPHKEGTVRFPLLIGYYRLTQKEKGNLEVVFESIVDPGGWIPKWIVNCTLVGMPWRTFTKFQELAPFEEYKDHRFKFIKKPPEEN